MTAAITGRKTTAWLHQLQAVEFVQSLYRHGGCGAMIAAAMGTGKSAITVYLCDEEEFQQILILCPLRVAQVWRPQFERHSWTPYEVLPLDERYTNVRAKRDAAERQVAISRARGVPVVIVINYDSAWRPPFAEWALWQRWDLLVADEIHRCKAPGGKASRYLARLGKSARFRLGLSGTPMPHSPLDVYGYFRFLDPTIFGWSFHHFRQHYALMGGFKNHQVVDYRNLEELHRRFHSITFAAGKDVLDLPPEMHVNYTCQLSAEARRAYRALERNLIAEVDAGEVTASNALVKLLRLQQITGGHIRTDDGRDVQIDAAKADLLGDVLEDIAPEEPVVVFCRFHRDLDAVKRVAVETGRQSLELSGRADDLTRWQAGEAPVLAVQIDSGGVGVDLTRARYAVYYSLGFSLGSYEQSLARIHRPGQTRPVEYIHLLAEGTVDERVMTALAERADVVNSVLQQLKGQA
ncbi:MAG: DEAD/DEAH box helicase [Bryobacteraceae bacterium]|nr:DEAD/DEAH box helicase [Bryobacteraceae bacterium]